LQANTMDMSSRDKLAEACPGCTRRFGGKTLWCNVRTGGQHSCTQYKM
jgi:hypothetical protein